MCYFRAARQAFKSTLFPIKVEVPPDETKSANNAKRAAFSGIAKIDFFHGPERKHQTLQ